MTTDQRLIEDYIPIEAISAEARREKSVRKGHISTLHLWWARRPLVAARAAVYGALVPATVGKQKDKDTTSTFVADLCKYPGSPSVIAEARRHILDAHAARLTTETGHLVTADDIEAGRAPRPRVLDMFAGGGAIPLEALRLGCEAYALDLNPVAHLIELCTLVYPQQYGAADPAARGSSKDGTWAGLAAEVEHWGKWVLKQVKAEIGDLYPPIPDPAAAGAQQGEGQLGMDWAAPASAGEHGKGMLTPVAYLWTRTVHCKNPACGGIVPLARQTWLATKDRETVALKPECETGATELRVRYRKVVAPTPEELGFDPAAGSKAGNVACPFCGTVADSGYVKREGQAGRMGVQALAAVFTRKGQAGKAYFAVDDLPPQHFPDDRSIQQRIDKLTSATGITIPTEKIVNDAKGSAWCVMYGLTQFKDLFTSRQMFAMLTFTKYVQQVHQRALKEGYSSEHAKVISTLLGLTVSRLSNFNSSLCTWFHSGGRGVKHVFARQALPMVWDFAETNPLNDQAASWRSCLNVVVATVSELAKDIVESAVLARGSALQMTYPARYFDAVITDPPYYDNVPYSNLADFFYVWLARSIGALHSEHFSSNLTPKKSEAVADASRHAGNRVQAQAVYESMMQQAFAEAGRVLKSDAPLVVVYAHKTTAGWSTLITAMQSSGFVIVEAWPLDTENSSRLRAMNAAALASSIFLVARRRENADKGSYEHDVRPNLELIVRERVDRLWAQGVTGADLVIACVGAGLSAFTKYARVEYANGEPVPADGFLAEVEGAVLEALLEKIFGVSQVGVSSVDAATRFYVLWRYAYRQAAIDAGEAIIFAYPQHVELDGSHGLTGGSNPLVEKQAGKYRLRDFAERGEDEKLGIPHNGVTAALVDVLHRVLWLVEHRPALIPAYLDDSRPDIERLRVVAQTLAGQTLAGNGSGGGRSLVAARGAEAAALRKLTTNWRSLVEAERRGMG
jgi:putative DNA methylase